MIDQGTGCAGSEHCRSCGAERPDQTLFPGGFCHACGRPVHQEPVVAPQSGEIPADRLSDGVFLVERGRRWQSLADSVPVPEWLSASRVALGVGLVVLAVGGLRLLVPSPADLDVAEEQPDASALSDSAQRESIEQGEGEHAADGEHENGGQSDARRQMSVSLADVVQGTAPIVGDGVGQYLFVDLADNLVRLDLDSGEQHWFETSGSVVGVTEHHLIVVSNRNVFAVDAVEPETGGRFLYELPGPVEPFWLFPTLLRMSDERVAITFTDLTQDISATGSAIVDSTGGPDDVTVVDYGRWWPAVPGLVSVPGAGVFDLFAPEPRKVFDGELVAGGAQRLIGVKCQDLDTCTTSLVARDTGEILVDDISAYGARPWQSRFIGPEDRLLVTWGEPDGRADPTRLVRIVDVESGEEVAPDFMDTGSVDLLSSAGPELLGSLDASSDSRLLATIGNNVVVIHDRVSETTVSINVEQGTRPGADPDRVFFVAKETS